MSEKLWEIDPTTFQLKVNWEVLADIQEAGGLTEYLEDLMEGLNERIS